MTTNTPSRFRHALPLCMMLALLGAGMPAFAAPAAANAGQVADAASPLGLTLGRATLADVRTKLGAQTHLADEGTNAYSNGPMLRTDGAGLGVDGLSNLVLIFDRNHVLAGVLMTLPKAPTDMMRRFAGKYKLVDNQVDTFLDKGYARYSRGDSVIEIDAPHLSFTMEVRYLTRQLQADFQRQSTEEATRKRHEQTEKF